MKNDLFEALVWLDRYGSGPVQATFTSDGHTHQLTLTPDATAALRNVFRTLAHGAKPVVLPSGVEISPAAAAPLLGCSRATIVRMIGAGQIPARKVGAHWRIRMVDVLDHRQRVNRAVDEAGTAALLDLARSLSPRPYVG